MADSYQAIYDAAFRALDPGNLFPILQQEFCVAAAEMQRPSVLYRPKLSPDGDMWMALYGANLHDGVAGFGKTPAEAMAAFDEAWRSQTCGRQKAAERCHAC